MFHFPLNWTSAAAVELQSVDCAAETMILATAENNIMLPDSFEGSGLYRFTII